MNAFYFYIKSNIFYKSKYELFSENSKTLQLFLMLICFHTNYNRTPVKSLCN